ncbi:MAG: glycerol-3-phosphate dehydrogenase/oxidase [Bacteroidota bacterium]
MNRQHNLDKLKLNPRFDVVVIGGGASGIGAALESTLRGYRTLLVEKHDFTKGTSSRSTKLVHGGVRYLAQGDVFLVLEALRERGYLRRNAPHLVHDQRFIIPSYRWWEKSFYTIGLTLYDLMAGRLSLGRSLPRSRQKVSSCMPSLRKTGLRGGVLYHDGQFDDSRLAMDLLHSLNDEGGLALNYFEATGILKNKKGMVSGITALDHVTGTTWKIDALTVINATGVWVDEILRLDHPAAEKLVRPSQGVHLVLNESFLPGGYALMIPKTDDGRVLFAVPWHGHIVVGTTDTPLDHASAEPRAMEQEIDFILNTAGRYLERKPQRSDVLSVFAGLRPLAAPRKEGARTREISRSHKLIVSESGLVTITGGKWTTYRKMAEDVVDRAAALSGLPMKPTPTKHFPIQEKVPGTGPDPDFSLYGRHAADIRALVTADPALGEKIHPALPYRKAEVRWILQNEMTEQLEDILARRLRALFLNARAAAEAAPLVAGMAAETLGWDRAKMEDEVLAFRELAKGYILS